MRYPEQVICRVLAADPAFARHVGFRFFPLIVPTSAALPFAVYRRSSGTRENTLSVPPGVPRATVELMIFASSYSQSREIADACRARLDHMQATAQGISVLNVTIEDETDDIVQLEGGDLPPAWQVTMRISVQWREN